jgi:TRAP-type mannitol/chloroaromatic compound transport system permease small subunit
MDSYKIHEISENPGGLPFRYTIKAMIPLAFTVLVFFAIGYTVQNINLYRRGDQPQVAISSTLEEES